MIGITHISEHVYVLKDRAGCCVNLVTGNEKALVFDTGSGIDDIYTSVRQITKLPLVVINSHGHFDHIGGNARFDTVYMHQDDFVILKSYTADLLDRWRRDLVPDKGNPPLSSGTVQWENMKALDFDTLNLGGLECRILSLKGHTRGSIGIWIPRLRLLLSGDALTPVMCMIFQNSMSVETQYETLNYVKEIDFDYYLTSHHSQYFPKQTVERLIRCLENSKTGKWHSYQYPYPPYAKGKIYVDSVEDEPVGLICRDGQS